MRTFLVLILIILNLPALAQTGASLPLPRFASLRSEEVNLRSGPGVRYPIDWVIQKRDLPVEIVAEYDTWRKIRDHQGAEGWVHQTMLSGRRGLIVTGTAERLLRKSGDDNSHPVAKIEPGVMGKILQCPRNLNYCRIEVGGFQGWMDRNDFWGVYRGEVIE